MASVSRLFPSGRHEALQVLLNELDDEERALLVLRVEQELEWEEIVLVLRAEAADRNGAPSDPPPNAAALRKRHERLVKRLHERARELGLLDD